MRLRTYFGATIFWLLLLIPLTTPQSLNAQCSPTAIEIPLNGIDEDCDGLDDIYLHLPPHIYTVAGQEFELYFRNLILSTHPNDYRFVVSTPLGGTSNLEKWVLTPTISQVGEHSFSLQVTSPGGTILKTANCIVRVSQPGTPPSMTPKKLLLWGHSFIDQGYMPFYLDSLLSNGTNPVVSFHGKRGNWIDNNKTRFEAVGGSSWLLYYNTPGSPFFYNGQLNLRAYFDEVCGFGQTPDWIVIHLDVNDYLFTGVIDGSTMQQIDDYITFIYNTRTQPMMAALRAAAPNTKIAISYTPMPNSRQSAFTNTFGANSILSNRYRWQKIVSRLLFRNTQFFAGRENENIYLLPIHLDLDDVNDYGISDPVHPVVDVGNLRVRSGYREIAKSTYAWLKYIQNPSGTPPACVINSATPSQILCNQNGTQSDPTDDTFTFNLTVAATNGTGSWRTTLNGQQITGNYNTPKSMGPFPISGGALSFTVTDNVLNTCSLAITVTPPATCSNGQPPTPTCAGNLLQNGDFENGRNNWNGTGTIVPDAAGGTSAVRVCGTSYDNLRQTFAGQPNTAYTLSLSAKREVSSTRNPYAHVKFLTSGFGLIDVKTLEITQTTYQSYSLNVTTPANIGWIEVALVVDSGTGCLTADNVCFVPATAAPVCSLSAQVTTILCNNNNTPNISTDDTFTCNLTVSGTNASTNGWRTTFNGQTISGAYGTARNIGPAPISIGTTTLTITDQATTACSTTVQVVPPAPCSFTTPPQPGTCVNNLLLNPGFENNLTSWFGTATLVNTAVQGTNAARLCSTSFATIRQSVAAQPNNTYTLQVQARKETPSSPSNPVLQIKFLNASWTPLGVKTQDITSPNYTNATTSLLAPAGTAWVEALVYVDGNSGCVLLDEFCLSKGVGNPGPQPGNYCTVNSSGPWEEWISSVRLNGTTKTSSKSVYSDHTSTQFNLSRTGNNTLDLTTTFSYFTYNQHWKVWIDYNQNGIFEEPSEVVVQAVATKPADGLNATKVQNAVFVVPANAPAGSTRMRVAMSRGVYTEPCQNLTYGEVEDFTVVIGNTLQSSRPDLNVTPSEAPPAYTVYPNPATHELWIQVGDQDPGTTVQVHMFSPSANTQLKQTFSGHVSDAIRLDLSTLQTGLYFVQIQVGGQRPVVEKVVVVRE